MELKRDEKQRDLKELQAEIDGAQQLVARETERLHRQEMNLTRIKTDLSQLSDRLWDTYELSYAGPWRRLRPLTPAMQGKVLWVAKP